MWKIPERADPGGDVCAFENRFKKAEKIVENGLSVWFGRNRRSHHFQPSGSVGEARLGRSS